MGERKPRVAPKGSWQILGTNPQRETTDYLKPRFMQRRCEAQARRPGGGATNGAVNRRVNRVEIMDNMEIIEPVTTPIIISFKPLLCDRIGECAEAVRGGSRPCLKIL